MNSITPGLIQTDITAGKLTDEMKQRGSLMAFLSPQRLPVNPMMSRVSTILGLRSPILTERRIDVNGGMLIHG